MGKSGFVVVVVLRVVRWIGCCWPIGHPSRTLYCTGTAHGPRATVSVPLIVGTFQKSFLLVCCLTNFTLCTLRHGYSNRPITSRDKDRMKKTRWVLEVES